MNEELTYERAKDKALRLLAFRAHSEKELADKLKRAGASSDDIENIIQFCREYKFVNDREYAIRKARDLYNLKKLGKRRIEGELAQKGIAAEYIAEAVEGIEFDEDRLRGLIEKRLRGAADKKSREKCIRYFMYRGYSLTEIKECMAMIEEE